MLDRIRSLFSTRSKTWTLRGYDTFAGEWYDLPGRFSSETAARKAARKALKKLEKMQPSRYSGGQEPGGIQDRVYIVGPDGSVWRYTDDE